MSERLEELKTWLQSIAGSYGLDISKMRPASADASFRRYFRVDGDKASYIVMDCPPHQESVRPFVRVDEIFAQAGLNVPVIFEKDEINGFLLLSDLGTQTYLDVINNENADKLMSDATDALVRLQLASRKGVLPLYGAGVLRTELELFPQWYVTRHLNHKITEQEHRMFDQMFELIVSKNLDQPVVYVHRDYMPRNLMYMEADNPGVIDFQDALYGPISYDITCLCRDAFVSWSDTQVLDWTIRYWDKARKAGLPVRQDFGSFWEDVEWMGLQRHLKVLGIFARINYRDGKPKYLADTPRFLKYVDDVVNRYDALKPLARFMDKIQDRQNQTGYTF